MADSNEEWELSKENIQPIQQGRQQKVLKIALAPHPEDLVLQQRQTFEYELRTYSGDDPLSVWYKYIKWVEQNFPKGGREGHIKQLIERCLSILKDEKEYYDDDRFIDILLKFANINAKPLDVYNYMYSHSIGCKSSKLFIDWSWELEQLGNFKKADEVLTEGIQRRTEPFDKIRSYQAEFDMRLANKIKEGSGTNNFESENERSAFAMLKLQKKNLAPVLRVGESVVDNRRAPLTFTRQQALPRSVPAQVKVPFNIYNSENIVPSLPVQSKLTASSVLPSEIYKENEQKPSKWNKVKVKPRPQNLRTPTEATPGFEFHCDEESDQQICTPRSVPKTSNVLSVRCRTPSPVMALFEPPDPMKMAMYPKKKVYGGAQECSLEEIRAAEWFERQKKMEQELLLVEQQRRIQEQNKKEEEMEKKIQTLTKQVELLQHNFVNSVSKPARFSSSVGMNPSTDKSENYKTNNSELSKVHLNDQEIKPIVNPNISCVRQVQNSSRNTTVNDSKDISENVSTSRSNLQKFGHSLTDTFQKKSIDSTSYREADKMVQELYNRTLSHSVHEADQKTTSGLHFDEEKKCDPTSLSNVCFKNLPEMNNVVEQKSDLTQDKNNLPFAFYHDPTEIISNSNYFNFPKEVKKEAQDNCTAQTIPVRLENEDSYDEDAENIPPKGYTQEAKKRELTGILEPSKNIFFIPLEEQEEMQDDSDIEDEALIYQPGQYANETLIPPSNTEQFSTAQFLSSTPCASRKNRRENFENLKKENEPSIPKEKCESAFSIKKNDPVPSVVESINIQRIVSKPDLKGVKETSALPPMANVLSVIMETSNENYSKSSSSSSSSANLTKSGHLDPFSSHYGSVRKPNLKFETFTSLSSVSEVPDSASKLSAYKNSRIPCKIQAKPTDEKQVRLFSADFDPFDSQLSCKLLKSVDFSNYENLCRVNKSLRSVKVGETISIGSAMFRIDSLIAEGAYAKVYEAVKPIGFNGEFSNERFALKACKNGNEFEFYICCELQKRLTELNGLPDVRNSMMNIIFAVKYSDGIVLANEYSSFGTLLDIVNFYKKHKPAFPEVMAMYLTLEILHIVSKLHELNIIHGDIKPDNFLITNHAFKSDVLEHLSEATTSLRLIDFGRAIDLTLYDEGICFKETLSTTHFKCNEMKENKPWVFQLDWYGVLNCIHTMLFSEYMVVKKKNDRWEIEKKFKRYWFVPLWEPLFAELLNIPECYREPNVKPFIDMIETQLQKDSKPFISQLALLATSFSGK